MSHEKEHGVLIWAFWRSHVTNPQLVYTGILPCPFTSSYLVHNYSPDAVFCSVSKIKFRSRCIRAASMQTVALCVYPAAAEYCHVSLSHKSLSLVLEVYKSSYIYCNFLEPFTHASIITVLWNYYQLNTLIGVYCMKECKMNTSHTWHPLKYLSFRSSFTIYFHCLTWSIPFVLYCFICIISVMTFFLYKYRLHPQHFWTHPSKWHVVCLCRQTHYYYYYW